MTCHHPSHEAKVFFLPLSPLSQQKVSLSVPQELKPPLLLKETPSFLTFFTPKIKLKLDFDQYPDPKNDLF